MQDLIKLGKKIYNMQNPREVRRMMVFVARGWFYRSKMEELERFFGQTPQLQELADIYPFVYEQPQRAFFYNQSTMRERMDLEKAHFTFLAEKMKPEILKDIYREKNIDLWQMMIDDDVMKLSFYYEAGQRKEGLLSVMLRLNGQALYQIIFWLAPDKAGDMAMWIGALQGPNMENSKEVIKRVTKACHSFRTKNLILYAAQAVARAFGLKHIYAVTNSGYYANNHVRTDRKIKTSFSDFWEEADGQPTNDKRFYELPLIEKRKTMEEVPTRKRAVYRKRFALMDEIDDVVLKKMKELTHEDSIS